MDVSSHYQDTCQHSQKRNTREIRQRTLSVYYGMWFLLPSLHLLPCEWMTDSAQSPGLCLCRCGYRNEFAYMTRLCTPVVGATPDMRQHLSVTLLGRIQRRAKPGESPLPIVWRSITGAENKHPSCLELQASTSLTYTDWSW